MCLKTQELPQAPRLTHREDDHENPLRVVWTSLIFVASDRSVCSKAKSPDRSEPCS